MASSPLPSTSPRAAPASGSNDINEAGNKGSNEHSAKENSVRPSSPLIRRLHHRLRDPDLVPRFENSRQTNRIHAADAFAGLIRPRWILTLSTEEGNNFEQGPRSASEGRTGRGDPAERRQNNIQDNRGGHSHGTPHPDVRNNVPERNYLDLRMEQMKMFGDDQCQSCHEILQDLIRSCPKGAGASARDVSNRESEIRLKKETQMMRAFRDRMEKGLAACPDHGGLRAVNEEWKEWMQRRSEDDDDGGSCDAAVDVHPQRSSTPHEKKDTHTISGNDNGIELRKGALGRADAAMRDVLAERAFLMDRNGNNGEVVGGYTLVPSQNNDSTAEINTKDSDGEVENERRGGRRDRRTRRKRENKRKSSREKSRKKKSKRSRKYYADDSSNNSSDEASHGTSSKSDINSEESDDDSRGERRKRRYSHKRRSQSSRSRSRSRRKYHRSHEKRKKEKKHRRHSSGERRDNPRQDNNNLKDNGKNEKETKNETNHNNENA